jgi:hypothetical protein
VDHRLVRDRFIESISHPAAALYLFLLTVADCQGLSYYSNASLMTRLTMDLSTLDEARQDLIAARLIAYEKPIYQVLSLDPSVDYPERTPLDQPVSVAQIFKHMMGGAK